MEIKYGKRWMNIFSRQNKAHLSIYRRDKLVCDCEKGKELQTGFEIHEDKIECPHCGKSYELRRPEGHKKNPFKGIAEMIKEDGQEVIAPKGTTGHKVMELQKGRI